MRTYHELADDAKTRITQIDAAEALRLHEQGGTVFVDVREHPEVNLGRIPGALHIPRGTLERDIMGNVADPDARIVLYCSSGNRSAFAAESLKLMGYTNVSSLDGGFRGWAEAGGDVED